ncbi:MAG: hypothetical protein IFK94_13700, partial [Acidobacteria bacterium]|nr:hypothetical protein [Candidatus Polarisedimenticola svalbardensis]
PARSGSRFAWIHLADLQDASTDSKRGEALATYDQALSDLDAGFERLVGFLETWSAKSGPVDMVLVGTYGVHLEDDAFRMARGSSYWLDRATLQVPAIIARLGDGAAAGRDSSPSWLPDIHATLRALAVGESVPSEHGVDLAGTDSAARRDARVRYAWTWAPNDELLWPVLTSVNTGSGWETFDSDELEVGTGESPGFALAQQHAAEARDYRLSDEVRRGIRESGIRLGDRNQRSPALTGEERVTFLAELFQLRNHFAQGRDRRAARTSNRMLTALPDNLTTLYNRGAFMLMAGGVEPAEALFSTMLERYPDTPEVLHWAAHLELAQQQPERAFALLMAARSLGWSDGDLLYDLACVHAMKGEKQEALASLGQAIEAGYRNWEWIDQDPDLASLRTDPGYARLMGARGR